MLDDNIIMKTNKDAEGKFGRILGSFWRTSTFAEQSVNDYLVEKHHAVRYYGQSKEDIKEEHLANREKVSLLGD